MFYGRLQGLIQGSQCFGNGKTNNKYTAICMFHQNNDSLCSTTNNVEENSGNYSLYV